jgi:Mg2+ and Co2+ transporter CorA
MQVYWVPQGGGLEPRDPQTLPALLTQDGGFVWVDLPVCDRASAQVLQGTFGVHPLAVQDVLEPVVLPKLHAYPDHLLAVLHAPDLREAGVVRPLELKLFLGRRYLVTAHGPSVRGLPYPAALEETRADRRSLAAARLQPGAPYELAYAVVSALARRLTGAVGEQARRLEAMEQRVVSGQVGDPETFLESLFRVRRELQRVRNMASQDREILARLATLAPRVLPAAGTPFVADLVDQFDRVRSTCDGQREYLQGVVDFYQTRLQTKMNPAVERLALLTAAIPPITAVGSVYGMNVILHDQTQPVQLGLALGLMAVVTAVMLIWARRQGWC